MSEYNYLVNCLNISSETMLRGISLLICCWCTISFVLSLIRAQICSVKDTLGEIIKRIKSFVNKKIPITKTIRKSLFPWYELHAFIISGFIKNNMLIIPCSRIPGNSKRRY